jgi:hypothetical protein
VSLLKILLRNLPTFSTLKSDDKVLVTRKSPRLDGLVEASKFLTGGAWGTITGTLSAQTDLQFALDAKTDNSTFQYNLTGLQGDIAACVSKNGRVFLDEEKELIREQIGACGPALSYEGSDPNAAFRVTDTESPELDGEYYVALADDGFSTSPDGFVEGLPAFHFVGNDWVFGIVSEGLPATSWYNLDPGAFPPEMTWEHQEGVSGSLTFHLPPVGTYLGQFCLASSGWWQLNGTTWVQAAVPQTRTSSKSVANSAARLALSLEDAEGFAVVDADTGKTWMLVVEASRTGTSGAWEEGDWLQLGDREISVGDITGLTLQLSTLTNSTTADGTINADFAALANGVTITLGGVVYTKGAALDVPSLTFSTVIELGTLLGDHPTLTTGGYSELSLIIRAKEPGAAGNSIAMATSAPSSVTFIAMHDGTTGTLGQYVGQLAIVNGAYGFGYVCVNVNGLWREIWTD